MALGDAHHHLLAGLHLRAAADEDELAFFEAGEDFHLVAHDATGLQFIVCLQVRDDFVISKNLGVTLQVLLANPSHEVGFNT